MLAFGYSRIGERETSPVPNTSLSIIFHFHKKAACSTGEPDSGRIDQIAALVLTLFKETEDAEGNVYTVRLGAEFSLYDDSFFPDEDGTSYQNFKIKVLYYN